MIGKKILYSGRVQGVGFRYECKRIAMGFEVNGTVENLDDGSVNLCVVGDELEVQDFLQEILINSNLSHHIIDHHEELLSTEELHDINGFSII
tara:strand:+ start:73 stop:351 length:279 start_codon:yes stop_codon:yes gene_type:complete